MYTTRDLFAEHLSRTPSIEERPFCPTKLLVDTDNDLIVTNDILTPSVGEVTHVAGRLLDVKGEPVRNAAIDILQGFGRFVMAQQGNTVFGTIKPAPYKSRQAPHIQLISKAEEHELWMTQLFIKEHPGNSRDGVYRRIAEGKRVGDRRL